MSKILVIGDSCEDVFIYGRCDRICPEAPVPVFVPSKKFVNLGMAMNVKRNIEAMGVWCDILTNEILPQKTRYVDLVSNQMIVRVDENDKVNPITASELSGIDFSIYDAIVISDYNKGYLSAQDIRYISNIHPLVFLDTKKKFGRWCLDVDFIKINHKEMDENGSFLFGNYTGDLIVTIGKDGAILNNSERFGTTEVHNIMDLSGAGDTFLAALASNYIESKNIRESIIFANKCASYVVTKKGVVTVDLNELS